MFISKLQPHVYFKRFCQCMDSSERFLTSKNTLKHCCKPPRFSSILLLLSLAERKHCRKYLAQGNGITAGLVSPSHDSHDGFGTLDAYKGLSSKQYTVRAHLGVEVASASSSLLSVTVRLWPGHNKHNSTEKDSEPPLTFL